MIQSYSEYQNTASSEKITLAIMEATKRLQGWTVFSGSKYVLTNFDFPKVTTVEDAGVVYTEVFSTAALIAGTYYHNEADQEIYLRASDSSNPNGRLIVVTVQMYFANVPIVLPNDLDAGYDVMWEPLIQSTSQFGVEIDTISQTSEAIEGSGSLSLINDFDFWPNNFDKLSFENKRVWLYSYHRDLAADEAKLIFKGRVSKKTYSAKTITFNLKDQFSQLKAPVPLSTIGDLATRTPVDLENAKQRMLFGRVYGHIPTNIDQVVDGYPITGTVSITFGSLTVTGSSTVFLTELSPGDTLVLAGVEYTIASITNNTSLTLSDEYAITAGLSGASISVIPDKPKRWMNRVFKVAGHAVREAGAFTTGGSSVTRLFLDDTTDFYPGDYVYVGTLGSGELAIISDVATGRIDLSTSLATIPTVGTFVRRPAIQNVRIDDTLLLYYRDYTFDPDSATLTLRDEAEFNASHLFQMGTTVAFTNTSRSVTGSGFADRIQPGYFIGCIGQASMFEVLSVESDTALTLRSSADFTDTDFGQYKALIYDEGTTVLSCDCLGRTDDGTATGVLLKTAPGIVQALLDDAGLGDEIDTASFTEAEDIAYQEIGIVVPETYRATNSMSFRDVINKVNKSVFGTVIQNDNFQFAYHVLSPRKPTDATKFTESDILSFSLNSTAENVVGTVNVEYLKKEYDYTTSKASISTKSTTSDTATYLVKTSNEKTVATYLTVEREAEIFSARWAFLLSSSAAKLTFTTKLQAMHLQVGDIIEVEHRKFFERFGGTGKRKLMMIESIKKSGVEVTIEAVDINNLFNRVAAINELTADYSGSSETEILYGGFITDTYGLVDNDPETAETNLIW